jgi:lysophospholipid acyltransferase (LPLAT)-like uncharacterized protein
MKNKNSFVLEKNINGTITISSQYIDFIDTGFVTPKGDGTQLNKFMKKLKEGDKIKITKENPKKK